VDFPKHKSAPGILALRYTVAFVIAPHVPIAMRRPIKARATRLPVGLRCAWTTAALRRSALAMPFNIVRDRHRLRDSPDEFDNRA
jgi:hypothetical protein